MQSANANRYDFASKSAFLSRSDGDNGRRNAQTVDGYGNARFASIRGRAPLFLLFAFRALSIPRIGRDPLFSVFEIRSTFPARSHVRNRAPRSERRPRLPLQQCIVHSRALARSKIARYAHISLAGRCGIDVSRYRWRRSRTRSRIRRSKEIGIGDLHAACCRVLREMERRRLDKLLPDSRFR